VHSNHTYLFEKFEIINCLKKDMQSSVYLARHIFLGRDIILKTLDTEQIEDPVILDRFKREAKLLAQLDHPNIIKVFDFGSWENFFYISFEYFPSRNLRKALKQRTFAIQDQRNVLMQILLALQIAHQNKIIHRDLKPENILIDDHLTVKIADFGLAHVDDDTHLTMPSALIGTPAYMAPEQVKGEMISYQSDIFSLGIIIYELFTGKHPFVGKDAAETLNNILKGYTASHRKSCQSLPGDLQQIIANCLQADPAKRYKNINQIIEQFDTTTGIAIKSARTRKQNKKKIILYPLTAAVVTLLVALYVVWDRQSIPEIKMDALNEFRKQFPGDSIPQKVSERPTPLQQLTSSKPVPSKVVDRDTSSFVEETPVIDKPGKLLVECSPWAYVYLNEAKIDSTPLSGPIILSPDTYTLALMHPDYPLYTRTIEIQSEEILEIRVDMDTLVGFLYCNVYPWAEVFIEDKAIGQTPFLKPVRLPAGVYRFTLRNPKYEDYSDTLTIKRNDTIEIKFDFKSHPIKVSHDSI
jgi:serine/threonine protein kinase